MRYLILSGNTGGGHNAAAAAIREEFLRRGDICDVEDGLQYLSEITSEIISRGHSYVYNNLPQLFGKAYVFEENHSPQLIYDSMSLGAEKFYRTVAGKGYDAIICVHIFAGMLANEAKKRNDWHIPLYLVATDYTCSPGTTTIDADTFFIPHPALTSEFVACGVPREKLVASGIPIKRDFYALPDKAEARKSLGLPPQDKIVLLFCGSIGCGRMNRIAPEIIDKIPADTTLVIICGHNRRTYKKLTEKANEHTVVIGYTDQIAQYMAAADICLGKPGGLSTTEMLVARLPMVLILAVPGCETRNLDFMLEHKFAVGATDWHSAIYLTLGLLNDPGWRAELKERLCALDIPCAAEEIVNHITATAKENENE